MQIISPPPGLNVYPGQQLGQQLGSAVTDAGKAIANMIMMKKTMEDEKAKRTLDYWMKTGELMGEFDKPTPAIQEAFKRYYGQVPDKGILATGGKTLEARKTEAAIKESEATSGLKTKMASYYDAKGSATGAGGQKGLEYAVKFANAKLGKPFEVLDDDEREMWNSFYQEGLDRWNIATTTGKIKDQPVTGGDSKAEGSNWLNRWKLIPAANRKNALSDPSTRARVLSEATALGLSIKDLEV